MKTTNWNRKREEGTRAVMAESIVVEFPSAYRYLNLVDLICGGIVDDAEFSHEAANQISISVVEACTNALEHGNKCRPEENVRVVFTMQPDRLVIEVQDNGEGFDYKDYLRHIPDPSDIHKQRGRGIYIMSMMMDTLSFEMLSDGGMKVTLEKMFTRECGEDA